MICSKNNNFIMVWGIDKSDTDLLCSQRVANRKDGNSRNHVQPIACAEKCAETYTNCKFTIFRKDAPTGRYLQNTLDDNYQMMAVTVGSTLYSGEKPKKATCALFLPFPVSTERCTNRDFKVTFNSDPVDEDDVTFHDQPEDKAGLPLQISMPIDQNDVIVQLILAFKNANRSISGYIISSDGQFSTACRFNNPI